MSGAWRCYIRPPMSTPLSPERYWRFNRWLIAAGLLLGFVVTFGMGWFARELDFVFFGWGFSFWVAAQGALLVYLLIVTGYAWIMNRLDARQPGSPGRPPA